VALATTSEPREDRDGRDPLRGAVVVGIDGRPEGLDALALADRMATLASGPLVVVAHYPYAPLSSRVLDGPTDAAAAARVLADARRVLGSRPAEYRSVPGSSPGRTLHETAQEHDAGLLVVGSSHHGPAGRLVLGTVTAETLRRAPCAVGVAPRGWADGARSLARIGVAVDGSERDAPAAAAAGAVACRVRPPASVRTVHVDLPAERAAGVGPVAADVLLEGDVVDALVAHSARLDLLVMGSRGLGRAGTVLLGSVAARLVGLARCPVLVLPS
jgi:nucleotide-binding universal stress UspA family protein